MENDIKNQVLAAIKSGDVKQHSRRYFVWRGILIGTGIGLVLCLVLYLASFIFFILRQTGVWFVPAFGFRGWFAFFRSLPWLLIALSAVFIIALEILVRRYAFTYKEPLVYSVVGILVIVTAGGFLLFETSLHRTLFGIAEQNNLPAPMEGFYRVFGEQHFDDIHTGMILATTTGGFIFQEFGENATASVVIASGTDLPLESNFIPSDTIVVFGSESGTIIQAVGIREAGSDVLWVAPPVTPPMGQ